MQKITRCLGTDDSVNACDCCGRVDLKATVAFETESGEVVYFGVVCAAKAQGVMAVEIRRAARVADNAKAEERRAAQYAAQKAHTERWVCHLVKLTGGIRSYSGQWDIASMIRKAGGFAAAHIGFEG